MASHKIGEIQHFETPKEKKIKKKAACNAVMNNTLTIEW